MTHRGAECASLVLPNTIASTSFLRPDVFQALEP